MRWRTLSSLPSPLKGSSTPICRCIIMPIVIPEAELEYQLAHTNQSTSPPIIALDIAVPIPPTIAVLLRLYSRRLKRMPWEADGFVMIGSLVTPVPKHVYSMRTTNAARERSKRSLAKHQLSSFSSSPFKRQSSRFFLRFPSRFHQCLVRLHHGLSLRCFYFESTDPKPSALRRGFSESSINPHRLLDLAVIRSCILDARIWIRTPCLRARYATKMISVPETSWLHSASFPAAFTHVLSHVLVQGVEV